MWTIEYKTRGLSDAWVMHSGLPSGELAKRNAEEVALEYPAVRVVDPSGCVIWDSRTAVNGRSET